MGASSAGPRRGPLLVRGSLGIDGLSMAAKEATPLGSRDELAAASFEPDR